MSTRRCCQWQHLLSTVNGQWPRNGPPFLPGARDGSRCVKKISEPALTGLSDVRRQRCLVWMLYRPACPMIHCCLMALPTPSLGVRVGQMRESAGFGSWHSTRTYMSRTKSRADKADGPRFLARRGRCAQIRESSGFWLGHSTRTYMPQSKSTADKVDGRIFRAWVMRQPVSKPPPSHPSWAPWPLPRSHLLGAR